MPDDERPARRAFVKLDRYGMADYARQHRLAPAQRALLTELVCLTDHLTHEWIGTLTELAEQTGATRRVCADGMRRFAAIGAVSVLAPGFGPGRQAVVRVLVYDALVVPEAKRAKGTAIASDSANERALDRADIERESRSYRADTAPDSANAPPVTCADELPRGSEAVREGGSDGHVYARSNGAGVGVGGGVGGPSSEGCPNISAAAADLRAGGDPAAPVSVSRSEMSELGLVVDGLVCGRCRGVKANGLIVGGDHQARPPCVCEQVLTGIGRRTLAAERSAEFVAEVKAGRRCEFCGGRTARNRSEDGPACACPF